MIAGEWWTPVGKNADKLAIGDVPPYMSFREVRKAKTFKRSFQKEAGAIEHKLPLDTNVELSPVLFELPRIEAAAVSRQAKIKAVVVGQVLRRLGPLALGEVGGRAYHGHPEVGANPNSYHILCNKLTGADACIDLLRYDVREPVVDNDLDVKVGVLRQNLR